MWNRYTGWGWLDGIQSQHNKICIYYNSADVKRSGYGNLAVICHGMLGSDVHPTLPLRVWMAFVSVGCFGTVAG